MVGYTLASLTDDSDSTHRQLDFFTENRDLLCHLRGSCGAVIQVTCYSTLSHGLFQSRLPSSLRVSLATTAEDNCLLVARTMRLVAIIVISTYLIRPIYPNSCWHGQGFIPAEVSSTLCKLSNGHMGTKQGVGDVLCSF